MLRQMVRPGGPIARVQASVHAAVRELASQVGRDALTLPMVAQHAGVTPSTIYRRWGDLQELMSDVPVERLRPDTAPKDIGEQAEQDELAITEGVLNRLAEQVRGDTKAAGSAAQASAKVVGRAVLLIPHRSDVADEDALPGDHRKILATVR
ncbi:helix-turn-helix domain-containing protein [Streptomyces sp. YGL11-2]|uniref:helix-turn-helix domain-containing protein n=1 Tax=Streptomyces sp. YGL11-2 TaxID=3414028 RepID=UPI003CE80351